MLTLNSGTEQLWQNKAAMDLVIAHPQGVTWGAHQVVISSGSQALREYVYEGDVSDLPVSR